MEKLRYVIGDATSPIGSGKKLIIHVCNDIGAWGAGFVLALSRKWKEPEQMYRNLSEYHLGDVQYVKVTSDIEVANMIGQTGIYRDKSNGSPPIRYPAIIKCLMDVGQYASENGFSIHAPRFGAGLAGGDWKVIESMIHRYIILDHGLEVIIYDLVPQMDVKTYSSGVNTILNDLSEEIL